MTQVFKYRSPTTPGAAGWVEDLGNTAVRLGNEKGFVQEAELGAVGIGSLAIDDPTGTAGHNADAIVGLKQLDIIELAAPSGNRRIQTAYIADRRYLRGTEGNSPSLRTGAARIIDMTLVDINSFLSFRVFTDEITDVTSSFNRPAETDIERITALLAVDFLSSTLFDGLVSASNPVNMDAVDYKGQRPADVCNDCAQQSGKNFFVFYDEAGTYTPSAGDFGLFYDFNDSPVYPTQDPDFRVSNVLVDVDRTNNVATGPTWEPMIDGILVRDPSRVISGAYFENGSNSVYVTQPTTSYIYGWRDAVGNSQNLKTIAQATARGTRYLSENSTEDDRITFTLKLPAANVNDCLPGQYFPAKFSHLPDYGAFRNVRCLNRNVAQDELTDEFYNVRYEVTPMVSGPQAAFAGPTTGYAQPTFSNPTTPGDVLVAFVITQANSAITTNPAQPIFSSAHSWTLEVTTWAWNAGQSSGPPGAVRLDIFSRVVALGEVTTTPDSVHNTSSQSISMYLYEVPAAAAPTATASISSNSAGPLGNVSTAPRAFSFATGLSGYVLSLLAWTIVDYSGCMRVIVTTGTEIQQNQANNNPALPLTPYPTNVIVPQLLISSGVTIAGTVEYPQFAGAYTTLGYCGVAVAIPVTTPIPAIPYPANQT